MRKSGREDFFPAHTGNALRNLRAFPVKLNPLSFYIFHRQSA